MLKTLFPAGLLLLGMAQASCDSPDFPVREGWIWTYQSSTGGSYQQTHTNVTPERFTLNIKYSDGASVQSTWTCNAQGFMSLDDSRISGPGLERLKVSKVSVSGVRMPAERLNVGTSWNYEYRFEGEIEGLPMTFVLKSEQRVVGKETITVPAGTFEAWKVQTRATTVFSNPMLEAMQAELQTAQNQTPEGMSFPVLSFLTPVVTEGVSWIAEGVGPVRMLAGPDETVLRNLQK